MAKDPLKKPTYSAFYQDDHSEIIYRRKPDDGALGELPHEAEPINDPRSSYFRTDGGDRFEFAFFKTIYGRIIVVQRNDYVPRR